MRTIKGNGWLLAVALAGCGSPADAPPAFDVLEKTIPELGEAMARGEITSRGLVDAYLARMAAYDTAGPALGAIVTLNPEASAEAEALDAERRARGPRGPLHGVPVVIKDNYDTAGLPTTGSSIALATSVPPDDAFQVRKLREAGAVILGKTNLHELAYGITSVSSLGGQTRNPYDPERNPGGSSGGTGAAVAASFAAAGMGSDTCGSIRIPAAHNNLVGLRPTRGLSSRDGIIPLSHTQDVGGPLARTVRDLAIMLDATVGPDPADPVTELGRGRIPTSYADALRTDALAGARLGIFRPLFGADDADRPVTVVIDAAIEAMKKAGAEVVEIAESDVPKLLEGSSVIRYEFASDLAAYLAATPGAPVASLQQILDHGLYHAAVEGVFRGAMRVEPEDAKRYQEALARRDIIRAAVVDLLAAERLDAIVYPTMRRTATRIGEGNPGSNCSLSATSGLPAITVPAGFAADRLPVGVELMAGPFAEPALLGLAYSFEQATGHRRPPASTPSLITPPGPVTIEVWADQTGLVPPAETGVTARARLSLETRTNELRYAASVFGVRDADVLSLHLHRRGENGNGPVVSILGGPRRARAASTLVLSPRDRRDLESGELYFDVHTRQHAGGAARGAVELPK